MYIWIQNQDRLQSTREASLKSPNFNIHVCNIVLTASEKSPLSLFFREIPIVLKQKSSLTVSYGNTWSRIYIHYLLAIGLGPEDTCG